MNDDISRNNQRRSHVILGLFASFVALAIVAAFATMIHGIDMRLANNDSPAGTIGLAHPHPPLNKGAAEPVR
jgi:hypothetical protein